MVMEAQDTEIKSGYKRNETGVIPEEWEIKSIGDLVTFSGGSQPPRSTFIFKIRDGYIRLIQIRDYKTDEFETYIPQELARKKCTTDDIMIGRYGPPIFQILRGIEGAYNVALLKAIPSSRVDREYLYHFLKLDSLFNYIELLSQRSSGQTGIEMPALKNFPFPLPPLPEQRAIATALSDVDALITSLNKLIAKKRDIKQATMQQLLTGKRRLPGFSGEWEVKKLGEIGQPYGGLSGKSKENFVDGQYPYIPFLNIMNNPVIDINYFDYVNIDSGESQNKAIKGDLFFNGSSETPEEVGMCSVLNEDIPNLYLNSFCFGFRLNKELKTNGLYLSLSLHFLERQS